MNFVILRKKILDYLFGKFVNLDYILLFMCGLLFISDFGQLDFFVVDFFVVYIYIIFFILAFRRSVFLFPFFLQSGKIISKLTPRVRNSDLINVKAHLHKVDLHSTISLNNSELSKAIKVIRTVDHSAIRHDWLYSHDKKNYFCFFTGNFTHNSFTGLHKNLRFSETDLNNKPSPQYFKRLNEQITVNGKQEIFDTLGLVASSRKHLFRLLSICGVPPHVHSTFKNVSKKGANSQTLYKTQIKEQNANRMLNTGRYNDYSDYLKDISKNCLIISLKTDPILTDKSKGRAIDLSLKNSKVMHHLAVPNKIVELKDENTLFNENRELENHSQLNARIIKALSEVDEKGSTISDSSKPTPLSLLDVESVD